MLKLTSRKFALVMILMVGLSFLAFMPQATNASTNAVALSCPNDVRIGQRVSCTATGLTVGTSYLAVALHSSGNYTYLVTAASSTEYFVFTFTSADSDGIVQIGLGTTTDYSTTASYTTSAVINLQSPAVDLPTAFFQALLSPVMILGIFVILVGAFFIVKKKR